MAFGLPIYDENLKRGQDMVAAAQKGRVSDTEFVFFAAFDGTNNDINTLAGDRFCTHVGQLWDQYRVGMGTSGDRHGDGEYYAGLGTRAAPFTEKWLPTAVTLGVIKTATNAYDDFARKASEWLDVHPGGKVSVVLAAFSRGAASAVIFSQLLYHRGLVVPRRSGEVLLQPGEVSVCGGVLFDPVATGVTGNLALPPNVTNGVAIRALNEYRTKFRAVDYSGQRDVITRLAMYGNHCDIGGGYDNGLGALSLEAATKFLKESGLAIADVPGSRRCNRNEIALHSERMQPGDAGEIWTVDYEDGFSFSDVRRFDGDVSIRPASGPTAS